MAGRISGITIEIGGDTTKLQSALKGVDKALKTTQSNLKDINKLLKFNPGNTTLLTQKQKELKNAISQTQTRLQELKKAQKNVTEGSDEWDALQREIIDTENQLDNLESEYRAFGSVAKQVVKAAGEKLQELGGKITAVGQKFAPASKAAAGFVTAMAGLGIKAVQTADDLNTLAQQTGLTTAEIQKMQYAADLVDVPLESITGALRKMKSNMTESNETFAQLGISVTDVDGNLRSATEVFFEALQALSQIENETERDQIAMALFGRGADELAGIIDDGGQALKEYGEEAEELGLILDQDTIDSLQAINDALDKIKQALKGSALKVGAKVAEAAMPVIEKLSGWLEKVSGWLDALTPQQTEMALKIAAVVAVIAPLLIMIGKIATGVGGLISAFSFFLSPVGLVIAAIVALVAIGIALYKNWDTIKAKAQEVWHIVVEKFNAIKASVTAAVTGAKEAVVNKWNEIKSSVTETIENIKSGISEKWDAIKTAVSTKVEAVKTAIVTKFNNLKTKLQEIVNKIKSLFDFKWKSPQLKLPHLKITYEAANSAIAKFFGVTQIPHLSVEWYKKAMQNPVLFTSPTVVGTPYGPKGFGESGAEIVMGLDKLRELVGSQDRNVTVQVVLQGDARNLFRVVSQTNNARTRATGYNALAMGV